MLCSDRSYDTLPDVGKSLGESTESVSWANYLVGVDMKIKVLGCHGSDLLLTTPSRTYTCRTCGFLVDDSLLLDAGSVASTLGMSDLQRIQAAVISHVHFDHIKGLPTLADNLVGRQPTPVVLASIPPVLDSLQTHIFNDEVYPDFLRLPDPANPVFTRQNLVANEETVIAGYGITPIPVNHLVPTVGFLIRKAGTTVLYSGDTFLTDAIWTRAASEPTLKAVFIEASFPDEMEDLARVSKHLTPSLVAKELDKLGRRDVAVYAYHLKPHFRERIVDQLGALNIPNLHVPVEGEELPIVPSGTR